MNPTTSSKKYISRSPAETRALAAKLAAKLHNGAVLALHGELGSGKTCFVRGLAQALDVRQAVTSPTFTIANEYHGRRPLIHMDLYRIADPGELAGIDFEGYLETEGIVAIEWAERAGNWLPADALHVYFESGRDNDERIIFLTAEAHFGNQAMFNRNAAFVTMRAKISKPEDSD